MADNCCNCSQVNKPCGCTIFGHGVLGYDDKWQYPCTHGSFAPCKQHQKPLYQEPSLTDMLMDDFARHPKLIDPLFKAVFGKKQGGI